MASLETGLPWHKKMLLATVPLLAALAIGEVAARLWRGRLLAWESFREIRLDMARRGYPAVHHGRLGYVPQPGYSSDDNIWGRRVTIDADGFRSNGPTRDLEAPAIVALGDSYTFGDQVADDETWPAHLERTLGRRVCNAGVFGYSFGQTVLRAEEVLGASPAGLLIVSLIEADISRCEFSRRYAPKPYFERVGDRLALRNVPVPPPGERSGQRWKNALGYSALLDATLAHTVREWWWGQDAGVRVHPAGEGFWLSLSLVERLAKTCRESDCELLLVVQGRWPAPTTDGVMRRARRLGVHVLDTPRRLAELAVAEPDVYERFWSSHMSREGNRWVAAEIAGYLRGSGVLGE